MVFDGFTAATSGFNVWSTAMAATCRRRFKARRCSELRRFDCLQFVAGTGCFARQCCRQQAMQAVRAGTCACSVTTQPLQGFETSHSLTEKHLHLTTCVLCEMGTITVLADRGLGLRQASLRLNTRAREQRCKCTELKLMALSTGSHCIPAGRGITGLNGQGRALLRTGLLTDAMLATCSLHSLSVGAHRTRLP